MRAMLAVLAFSALLALASGTCIEVATNGTDVTFDFNAEGAATLSCFYFTVPAMSTVQYQLTPTLPSGAEKYVMFKRWGAAPTTTAFESKDEQTGNQNDNLQSEVARAVYFGLQQAAISTEDANSGVASATQVSIRATVESFAAAGARCNYADMKVAYDALFAFASTLESATVTDQNGWSTLEGQVQPLMNAAIKYDCIALARTMSTSEQMADRVEAGTTLCEAEWKAQWTLDGSYNYTNDPCCNSALKQCCSPRDVTVKERELPQNFTAAASCQAAGLNRLETMASALFSTMAEGASLCQAPLNQAVADAQIPMSNMFSCWSAVYNGQSKAGTSSCSSNDECWTDSCMISSGSSGQCTVDYDNTAQPMINCMVAKIPPKGMRRLRKSWGLKGNSTDAQFRAKFMTETTQNECRGPYGVSGVQQGQSYVTHANESSCLANGVRCNCNSQLSAGSCGAGCGGGNTSHFCLLESADQKFSFPASWIQDEAGCSQMGGICLGAHLATDSTQCAATKTCTVPCDATGLNGTAADEAKSCLSNGNFSDAMCTSGGTCEGLWIYGDGACFKPATISEDTGASCPSGGHYVEPVGCQDYSVATADACTAASGTWVTRPKSKAACEANADWQYCSVPGEIPGPIRNVLSQSECTKCGGTRIPYFSWRAGSVGSATWMPTQWKAKGTVQMNSWGTAINVDKIVNLGMTMFYGSLPGPYSKFIRCQENQMWEVVKGVSCACTNGSATRDCFGAPQSQDMGTETVFSGLASTVTYGKGDVVIGIDADTISPGDDALELTMSTTYATSQFTPPNATTENDRRMRGRYLSTTTTGSQYLVLLNNAGTLVGQVKSDGYTPSFNSAPANPFSLSISTSASIPTLCSTCTMYERVAMVTASGTKMVYGSDGNALNVTASGSTWTFAVTEPATYYLAYEYASDCTCTELTAARSTIATTNAKTSSVSATLTFGSLPIASWTASVATQFKATAATKVGADAADVTITSATATTRRLQELHSGRRLSGGTVVAFTVASSNAGTASVSAAINEFATDTSSTGFASTFATNAGLASTVTTPTVTTTPSISTTTTPTPTPATTAAPTPTPATTAAPTPTPATTAAPTPTPATTAAPTPTPATTAAPTPTPASSATTAAPTPTPVNPTPTPTPTTTVSVNVRYPNIDFSTCCNDVTSKNTFLAACSNAQTSLECSNVVAGSVIITFTGTSAATTAISSNPASTQAFGTYNLNGASFVADSDGAAALHAGAMVAVAVAMASMWLSI